MLRRDSVASVSRTPGRPIPSIDHGQRRDNRSSGPRPPGAGRRDQQNPINLVKATVAGLEELRSPRQAAELRGLSVGEVLGGRSREDAPDGD